MEKKREFWEIIFIYTRMVIVILMYIFCSTHVYLLN